MTQNLRDKEPPYSLPPEFPKPPLLPDFDANTELERQIYERRKLLLQAWESSLKSYYVKEKEGDKEGMKKVLVDINDKFHDEDLDEAAFSEEFAESGAPDGDLSALLEELRKEQRETVEEAQRSSKTSKSSIMSSNRTHTPSGIVQASRRTDSSNVTPPTSPTTAPTGEKNPTGTKPSSRMDILTDKWLGSTLYNTLCTIGRRQYLFIPLQVILIIMIIVSTVAGSMVVGVVCGLGGGLGSGVASGWVVWGYRKRSPYEMVVPVFYIVEGLAFVAGLCGIIGDENLFFSCGIPGVILAIVATVLGRIGIISPLKGLKQDQDDSEIA